MPPAPTDAAIYFPADGYDLDRPYMLGRQSAGHGFLRAAVKGRGPGPIYGYATHGSDARQFARMVQAVDPHAATEWIGGDQVHRITQARGVLYVPDANLTAHARMRLRAGPGAYALCGVTHTLSTAVSQRLITELLSEPVMPWDALVCTSSAAVQVVQTVLEAQSDYLRWRFGSATPVPQPQLPLIPLGVHCADFSFSDDDKSSARRAVGLADDEFAALYVGRLVFTSKAHPFPMFRSLQIAAERSGKKVALILCGNAPTDAVSDAFLNGAKQFAPDVRIIPLDSRQDDVRRSAWAAGDLFISLSDGIQETFGLTPIEAMAAGLAVVVSDWSGYRDTVRDGVDGFRIATWAPEPGEAGESYAVRQELGAMDLDHYLWAAASTTSVDLGQLVERVTTLMDQPDLRRSMGEAGRTRARQLFDWPLVFRRYQELWGELNARRLAATETQAARAWADAGPRASPAHLDPYRVFEHYPTVTIRAETQVELMPGVTLDHYRQCLQHPLFTSVRAPEPIVLKIWSALEKGAATVATLATAGELSLSWAEVVCGTLAKMGIVSLR